ncbi:uncharacterized protein LOC121725758 [Aricia agestis]|uniref:uncharacterized protein LOC121725758 n=1 Tax=Aricia agestis TaxID=91739 RepID=UPI001C204C4E|nr:uncharacterized protein LOC121725758 [Aricia agestis]
MAEPFVLDSKKDPWYLRVLEESDALYRKIDEKLSQQQQQIKAIKKRTELESKLDQELKLKEQLTQKLDELSRRGGELDRVCAALKSRLTIADSDQNRLDNAKETYQLAKELTGVRFDFSAPPNVAKGYVKNEARKVLQSFEMQADSDALWNIIHSSCDPAWQTDKENHPPN